MSCQRLVCAYCAGPVCEGRCAVCRQARAGLHTHSNWAPVLIVTVVAFVVALIVAVVASALLTAARVAA